MNNGIEDELQQAKRVKRCHTLLMVGLIGAPVSLIIGGVALAAAALVCSIISLVTLRKMDAQSMPKGDLLRTLHTQAIIAVCASCLAVGMNLVAFIYTVSIIVDAMNSGTLSELLDSLQTGEFLSGGGSSSSSVWD